MSRVTCVKSARELPSLSAVGLALLAGAWLRKAPELVAMQNYHRLASDVNLEEEVEVQRLEGGGGAPAATLTTGMQVDAVQEE